MPQQTQIDEMTSKLAQREGSDLHLKVGAPPAIRVHGLLEYLEGYEVLRPVDTEGFAKEISRRSSSRNLRRMERKTYPTRSEGGPFSGQRVSSTGLGLYSHALHPIWSAEVRGAQSAGGYRHAGA